MLSSVSYAQTDIYTLPSISADIVYDDNLYFSTHDRVSDRIYRVSPGMEVGMLSESLSFSARYRDDAERYSFHPEFDSIDARQQATLDVHYQPTPRLTTTFTVDFGRTQQAGELNLDNGLGAGRLTATRATLGSSAIFRFDTLDSGSASYNYTYDGISHGVEADTHQLALGYERQLSPRDSISAIYRINRYQFYDPLSPEPQPDTVDSFVFLAGLTHQFDPRLSLNILAGPRYTKGSTTPELSAAFHYLLRPGDLSIAYTRTQTTAIGQVGVIDTNAVVATAEWAFGRPWEVTAGYGAYVSRRGELQANVYRFDVSATYHISIWLACFGTLQLNRQKGSLEVISDDGLSRNIFMVGIIVAAPSPPGVVTNLRKKTSSARGDYHD